MNEYTIVVDSESRFDKYLSENVAELTRSGAVSLIESGDCTVNGCVVAKRYAVKPGDVIRLTVPEPVPVDILPEEIPLDVLYEDDWVIVVNKPRGMIVHPAAGRCSGTLVNALMHRCGASLSGINGVIRPGIVHRIDKDTSGLIAVAKNDTAHLSLAEQLKKRTMVREYEAVVHGRVNRESGSINAPIGRSVSDRKKMCVTTKNAREAVTDYEVVETYSRFTHIRARLHTGRTHQIRVHMAYIGHSVAGDSVYGNGKPVSLGGQCLHAKRLGFVHPNTNEFMEVESALPAYFKKLLEVL
ncbi:MAG: RluA family pseudouridine synthase [Oscillospiraceae bacterium]|nr:RluA family pseudouridine synthase [Oscillospiraceae bacterium]